MKRHYKGHKMDGYFVHVFSDGRLLNLTRAVTWGEVVRLRAVAIRNNARRVVVMKFRGWHTGQESVSGSHTIYRRWGTGDIEARMKDRKKLIEHLIRCGMDLEARMKDRKKLIEHFRNAARCHRMMARVPGTHEGWVASHRKRQVRYDRAADYLESRGRWTERVEKMAVWIR